MKEPETITIQGIQYELLYALRQKGKIKYDLITKSKESIINYLQKAHRCKKEEIHFSHNKHKDDGGS